MTHKDPRVGEGVRVRVPKRDRDKIGGTQRRLTFSKAWRVRSAVKAASSAVGACSFSTSPLFSLMLDSWEYTILSRLVPCFTIASCFTCDAIHVCGSRRSDQTASTVSATAAEKQGERDREGQRERE